MVRGPARTALGHPALGEKQEDGEPPRSTLAVQLVNHFTDGKKHPKNQDEETFRQLLSEVLSFDDERGSQGQTSDVGEEVSYKLIYVLLRAGLDTMMIEDPFSKQKEKSIQVIDCLSAVETTLKRCPGVLFVEASGQVSGPDRCGPLFIWLIPKILLILSHGQSFKESSLRLLRTILCLERRAHSNGIQKYSVLKFMKGCIVGWYSCCSLQKSLLTVTKILLPVWRLQSLDEL